ncbi:MAG: 30S ribosomal protein S8 [Patescibacteria group bacterium]
MYTDLLIQLKNAQAVKKESIKVPYSKMDEEIVKILTANNYVGKFEKRGRSPRRILDINLKYPNNEGAIQGIKFISKPSRRIYVGYKEIRPIKHGYGLMVLSTPQGIMAGGEAKKEKVGGEALFEIW